MLSRRNYVPEGTNSLGIPRLSQLQGSKQSSDALDFLRVEMMHDKQPKPNDEQRWIKGSHVARPASQLYSLTLPGEAYTNARLDNLSRPNGPSAHQLSMSTMSVRAPRAITTTSAKNSHTGSSGYHYTSCAASSSELTSARTARSTTRIRSARRTATRGRVRPLHILWREHHRAPFQEVIGHKTSPWEVQQSMQKSEIVVYLDAPCPCVRP